MGNRFNWTAAVEGKPQGRGGSGGTGGYVARLEYEIGEFKRVVIPALIDPETNIEEPIIFQRPVHDIDKGTFTLEGSKGGQYTPFQIRCMNPLSQTDPEVTKKIAERKQYCIPCLMASLSQKEYFAEMDATFGSVEGYQAATKEEKKVFNDRMKNRPQIRESYDSRERKNKYSMEMLLLELETTTSTEKDEFGIESEVTTPVLEDGKPKYKAVLFKVSDTRLTKFTTAVQTAMKSKSLSGSKLHKLEEDGKQVLTTFVDFELEFPVKDTKMKSAAEMTIRAVRDDETIITPEFITDVQARSKELLEKAESAFKRNNANLGEFTNEQFLTAMDDKGRERYKELMTKYFDDNDKAFIQKVMRAASGEQGVFNKTAPATEEGSAQDIKSAPVKETASTTTVVEAAVLDDKDDLLSI